MSNTIFDISYGEERIRLSPLAELHIYEGVISDLPGGQSPFQVMRGSQESILSELEFFKTNCPGTYTLFLKEKRGQPLKNSQKIVVDCNPSTSTIELNGITDPQAIRQHVLREVSQQQKERERQEELQELKDKISRYEKPADRLTDLLAMALTKFLGPSEAVSTLNSTEPMRYKDQRQDNAQKPDRRQTRRNDNNQEDTSLEDCCAWLINRFGEDDFIRLVEKLSNDEAMQQMIVTYIN